MSELEVDLRKLPLLLTVMQFAAVLQVSVRTVKRWIASGELQSHKLPKGAVRIQRSELFKLLGLDV